MNLVKWLIEQKHEVDCQDHLGQTPLFLAVDNNRVDVISHLVSCKAELNLLDSDNVTVQHLAGFQGLENNSDWLMYHGAWKNRFSVEQSGPPKKIMDDEGNLVDHEAPPDPPAPPAVDAPDSSR